MKERIKGAINLQMGGIRWISVFSGPSLKMLVKEVQLKILGASVGSPDGAQKPGSRFASPAPPQPPVAVKHVSKVYTTCEQVPWVAQVIFWTHVSGGLFEKFWAAIMWWAMNRTEFDIYSAFLCFFPCINRVFHMWGLTLCCWQIWTKVVEKEYRRKFPQQWEGRSNN